MPFPPSSHYLYTIYTRVEEIDQPRQAQSCPPFAPSLQYLPYCRFPYSELCSPLKRNFPYFPRLVASPLI